MTVEHADRSRIVVDSGADSDGESSPWAARVAALLTGRRVGVAESCTAGQIATALASVDGASDFFSGGIVAYQERIKRQVLEVTSDSVLCEEAAVEMARGVQRLLGVRAALATTGVGGPEPVDGLPAGTVFIATVVDDTCGSVELRLHGSPTEVCNAATDRALQMLARHLEATDRAEQVAGDRSRHRPHRGPSSRSSDNTPSEE
jgi:PncC family amidohydrolase